MSGSSVLFLGEDIKRLLLQRNPILMVDGLSVKSDDDAQASLRISEGNLFCFKSIFTEPGLIEHIAQSASALVSYLISKPTGEPSPALGVIGEVKKFKLLSELPHVGAQLLTDVHISSIVGSIYVFSAQTVADGRPVASCQMKLSVQ